MIYVQKMLRESRPKILYPCPLAWRLRLEHRLQEDTKSATSTPGVSPRRNEPRRQHHQWYIEVDLDNISEQGTGELLKQLPTQRMLNARYNGIKPINIIFQLSLYFPERG